MSSQDDFQALLNADLKSMSEQDRDDLFMKVGSIPASIEPPLREQVAISFKRGTHDAIQQSIATPFKRASDANLGLLIRLPNELLQQVLLHLDLDTLFRLRQVNVFFQKLVCALPEYKRAIKHGLNLFCAALRTGAASHATLADFDKLLCTRNCETCGQFAGYVSMLPWGRTCLTCTEFRSGHREIVPYYMYRPRLKLNQDVETHKLQIVTSLPGHYRQSRMYIGQRIPFVQMSQLCSTDFYRISTDFYRITRRFERLDLVWEEFVHGLLVSCALPWFNRQTGRVERDSFYCAICHDRNVNLQVTFGLFWGRAPPEPVGRCQLLLHFKQCHLPWLLSQVQA